MFAAWREELDWEERLLERVANPANLEAACQRVVSNKGAAGVDGMTVLQLQQWARHHLAELREQLLQGRYAPQAVRGVSIPKPNGGVRRLGIPTVIDRVVQQAFVQVLTPMLDPQMSESSYGFRPDLAERRTTPCLRGAAWLRKAAISRWTWTWRSFSTR